MTTRTVHTGDFALLGALDVGQPNVISGLAIGEGGSYQTDVVAFTYDASAVSGSRFTTVSNINEPVTQLKNVGDRLYVGAPSKFWAFRFGIATAMSSDGVLQTRYWNGSTLATMTYMGVCKDSAISLNQNVLQQTTEKEYVSFDKVIDSDWTSADNVLDTIPNTGSVLYYAVLEIVTAPTTTPVISEIKVRGSDFDIITGSAFTAFWGKTRVESSERVVLGVQRVGGNSITTTTIAITGNINVEVYDFDSAGETIGFVWKLPAGIDTSCTLRVTLDYITTSTTAQTFTLHYKKLTNGTAVGPSESNDGTITTTVTPTFSNTFYRNTSLTPTTADQINIQNMGTNDSIAFSLEKTGNSPQSFYPLSVIVHYTRWIIGERT